MYGIMSETDFTSYTDDNTTYVLTDSVDDVVKSVEDNSINLFKWFLDKQMKAN